MGRMGSVLTFTECPDIGISSLTTLKQFVSKVRTDRIRLQVGVGDTPQSAHTGYWKNETVIRETAQLFYDYAS
jgi:hypothetical protein